MNASTALRVWMAAGPVQHGDLADRLEISRAYLSQLRYGVRSPAAELAGRIERVTGGAVAASSWPSAALVRATNASRARSTAPQAARARRSASPRRPTTKAKRIGGGRR